VFAAACPKSLITGESMSLLEEFFVWKQLGRGDLGTLTARQVDAFTVLNSAMAMEEKSGQQL
jgi:hypothetical protein